MPSDVRDAQNSDAPLHPPPFALPIERKPGTLVKEITSKYS